MPWIRVSAQLLPVLATALLAGCPALPEGPRFVGAGHERPVRGGTLLLWEESKVRSLDPHVAFDQISGVLIQQLYDSLYGYTPSLQLKPELAAALPTVSADGRTFLVPLRKGARFHNGREVTAHDVVWSFERMLSRELESPGAAYYQSIVGLAAFRRGEAAHIGGIRVRDRYLVEFELGAADQSFVHTLAMRFAAPVPKEEVARLGRKFAAHPIGTGPYRLASWDRGVRLVLERNPHYHVPGEPYPDRYVFEEGLEKETAFLRFRNGEVDFVSRITPADTMYLTSHAAWKKYALRTASVDIYAIGMNTEMPPFDNVHVRRAVAFALDRERWAKARNYLIRPTGQMLPPAIPGYDPELPNVQRFDLARAKEEMRLAGFPNGLPDPIKVWGTPTENQRRYFELAQADLSKIGIRIEPKFVSFPVYLEETGKPKTAQLILLGWIMDYPDASNFLAVVSGSTKTARDSVNRAFYADPQLDALLARALVERDPAERVRMYREANDFVAREAPWAFFANNQIVHAVQPYLRGFENNPAYWMDMHGVWLDLPRKRLARLARENAADARWAGLLPRGAL